MKKVLLIAGLAVLSAQAFAQDQGFYVHGGIGRSDANESNLDNDTSFNIGLGWRFNDHFSVEGGYNDFGDFKIKNVTASNANLSADSIELGLAAKLPFGENGFFGKARLGAHRWDGSIRSTVLGVDDSGTDVYFGVGLGYDFNERVGLSLNFDRYAIDDLDVNRFGIGGEVRF